MTPGRPSTRVGHGAALAACLCLLPVAPLWAQTAFRVKDINTTAPLSSSTPTELTAVNGGLSEPSTLFFVADDGLTGVELWRSDGTDPGTIRVKDIVPGPTSSNPSSLTPVGGGLFGAGRLFFTANDGVSGVELWTSNGTGPGTHMVRNIYPGFTSSSPDNLTAVSSGDFGPSRLFFTANDGTSGVELWVSDGTFDGTVRVADINPTGSSSPRNLAAVGSVLYFSADDGVAGREPWKSDGTEKGTVRIADIQPGPIGSSPYRFAAVGDSIFFVASPPALGGELWKTDGTGPGTTLVKDIVTGPVGSFPGDLVALGSTLYFHADDGSNGRELWKSDGTGPGTMMVADINPAGDGLTSTAAGDLFVRIGDSLYFEADDGVHGEELWRSDGSTPGTALVKNINPDPGSHLDQLTNVHGKLFFRARNGPGTAELWTSDGRAAGTFQISDILPGPADASPFELTVVGPYLFFSASGRGGRELWATDVVFKDGFETGSTDVWSSANTDGGDLSVQPAATLHATQGLAAHVDDTTSLFVADESPRNEIRYRARFRLDPNGFDPGEGNGKFRVRVFMALQDDPQQRVITLVLRRMGGQFSLMGRVRLDDGSRAQTPFFAIPDSPHMVEVDWKWSEGADANNGSFALWIDEIPVSNLTGLDNSANRIDIARLGVMTVKPGANGTLFFDDFESRRERYIGYMP
jgi:ELWxxDGT repeat protein